MTTPVLGAQLRSARVPVADKASARPVARASKLVVRAGVSKETDPKKRIVITGMGIASVFGNDPDKFYDALLAGTSGISLIDRFDTTDYPTRFAGQIKNFECVAPTCVCVHLPPPTPRKRAVLIREQPWAQVPYSRPASRGAWLVFPDRCLTSLCVSVSPVLRGTSTRRTTGEWTTACVMRWCPERRLSRRRVWARTRTRSRR